MLSVRVRGRQSMHDEDWRYFMPTGRGAGAARSLHRFWEPSFRSQALSPGQAVPIRIMNEDFTLYRGEAPNNDIPLPNPPPQGGREPAAAAPTQAGQAHLVAFRCAHRGTQLSVGWVEDDCLRCRYHGW